MIDSNDKERIDEAREELYSLLDEDDLKNCVLLILANKQDLPNAMRAEEIRSKLNVHSLKARQWYLQSTCAVTGQGLQDGMQWLAAQFKQKHGDTKKTKLRS